MDRRILALHQLSSHPLDRLEASLDHPDDVDDEVEVDEVGEVDEGVGGRGYGDV